MIQIVALFLIGMVVLAIMGRLRRPGGRNKLGRGKCPSCGRHLIGRGPCSCGRGDKA